jgi:DNA gyrase subunit A
MADNIQPVQIATEARRRYLNYALSVIMGRALPDVRDGLKPGQRRILYVMWHDLHLAFEERPRKCAKIVGDVIGSYHPHGDSAVYDTLVRMAQPWVMRVPLVLGQGNFGSVDGDPPAAYRYTEARLTAAAAPLLSELKQTSLPVTTAAGRTPITLRPTFDGSKDEPTVLPAQYPNLLVNGAAGIAVGMATSIPPHNLRETIAACVVLVDKPDASLDDLLHKIKGPDFPLGGKIVANKATLRTIYETGQGTIKVQAEWKEEGHGKKRQIVISSLPYGVDKGKLEETIGGIIEERKLPQATGLTNESKGSVLERDGIRMTIDLKPDADANIVMAYLFKHTALQETISFNLTCLVPSDKGILQPKLLGLKDMLRYFLDFRFATVRRRFEYELEVLRRRIHLLEGFRIIFNALDKAIKLIRESSGKADAAEKIKAEFKIDDEQTTAILDAQLYKIAQLEIQKILDELKDKRAEAAKLEALLKDVPRLWTVVKDELNAIAEKYGDKRRTKMAGEDDVLEFDPNAYIQRENTNVVLTRDGWLKRVGRLASVESTRVREGDEVLAVVPGSTVDAVVFFADDGTAYTLQINEVPASSGYGEPISKFFKLADQVKIIAAVSTDERFTPAEVTRAGDDLAGPFVLAATKSGLIVRTPLAAFRTASTKGGRRYLKLTEGDQVVLATVITSETGVMLASAGGWVLHFAIDDVPALAGAGKGVVGIKLTDGDTCIGGGVIGAASKMLTVETTANKTLDLRGTTYPPARRANKGTEVVKRSGFARIVPPAVTVPDWDRLDAPSKPDKPSKNGDGHVNGALFS